MRIWVLLMPSFSSGIPTNSWCAHLNLQRYGINKKSNETDLHSRKLLNKNHERMIQLRQLMY